MAGELLASSPRGFHELIETIPDAIMLLDFDRGVFVDGNRHACDILGLSREEFLSVGPADVSPATQPDGRPSREAARQEIERALAGERPFFDWVHRHKSGRRVDCEIRLIRFPSDHGRLVCGTLTDVTERKRAERALRESEAQLRVALRMETVGRFASGMAHDFNNLLTVIGGYSELAAADLAPDHPAAEALRHVREAVTHGESLTRGLLTFARQEEVRFEPLPIAEVVRASVEWVARTLPDSIRVELDLEGGRDTWVLGDRDQLGQVLLNLALNARDAMPGGGRLSVSLHADHDEVVLEVADSGAGVPRELADRIFEPFFTTKPRGKGTGLGLAILLGIVQAHGGDIELVQPSGRSGATFRVRLPRTTAPTEGEAGAPPVTRVRPLPARVLAAEDDPRIAELVQRALGGNAVDVERYGDGISALEAFAARPHGFDGFVLDHDLPGVSGLELARRVREVRAQAPILIVTGHPFVDVSGMGGGVRVVQKPFASADLVQALGDVFEEASAGSATPE